MDLKTTTISKETRERAGGLDVKVGELLAKVGPAGFARLADAPEAELAALLDRLAERVRLLGDRSRA